MGKILLVDDDKSVVVFKMMLRSLGHNVCIAHDADDAIDVFKRNRFDIILSDYKMPGTDGIGLLEEVRRVDPNVGFVILTAYPSTSSAVRSIKLKADNYIEKPVLDFDEFTNSIKKLIDRVGERRRIDDKTRPLFNNEIPEREKKNSPNFSLEKKYPVKADLQESLFDLTRSSLKGFCGLIGVSKKMVEVYRMIRKIAPSDATVLIKGDTGTGKELAARIIHDLSFRRDKPFIVVHCASIPETLLPSELFGHEKGAFTGADKTKIGLFEYAHNGTLFLDEIAEILPSMQLKLLRVLQEKEIMRLGSCSVRKVNVRIVAASNKDLLNLVHEKEFREDLYFRLDVLSIQLPSLRKRVGDIKLLIDHFITKMSEKYNKPNIRYTKEALELAKRYSWPGNIRELINVVERAVLMAEDNIIEKFPINIRKIKSDITMGEYLSETNFKKEKQSCIEEFEREYLMEKIEKNSGNIMATSKEMGLDVRTVWRKIKQYGLKVKDDQ